MEAIWPTFMAGPFIAPSTSTTCSAASRRRRASAALRSSSERTRLAALVAYALATSEPTRPPTFAVRRTRPVGIGLVCTVIVIQVILLRGVVDTSGPRPQVLANNDAV